MPEEKHAKYSPSQIPRIIRCPGSVNATLGMPNDSSPYAEEGTMLHEVTEKCLGSKQYSVPDYMIEAYKLDKDQTQAVTDCLEFVLSILMKHNQDKVYETVESKVYLEGFAKATKCEELYDVYGTVDYMLSVPSLRHLYVIDWKYGKGIEVFPDSEQLLTYALGALKNPTVAKNFDSVTIIVGQPRLYAGELFKEETFEVNALLNWLKEELVPPLQDINSPNPKICASAKACQWCKIKGNCRTRNENAHKAAQSVFAVHAKLPTVDIEEVTTILAQARDLKKYIGDLEAFITNRLKQGKDVPGYKLVAGRSIRIWKDLDEKTSKPQDMLDWAENLGYSEFDLCNFKLMSPAQVEKKLGRKLTNTDEFKAFIHKPTGKPTLVQDTDKRDALKYDSATDKFADFV